jgi:hypothetical protein
MSSDLIQPLTDQITKTRTVLGSAKAFANGVPGLIADAVAKAINNGATPEELKPVSDLAVAMGAESDELAAAILANTPAAGAVS